MTTRRPETFTVLVCCIFVTILVSNALAVDYNVGVPAGQWMKYGNITATGEDSEALNQTEWFKVEVTAVSGKNATLRITGQFKNGTATNETDLTTSVETGLTNESSNTFSSAILIAANLQQGDLLPAFSDETPVRINKTESRTYLGTSRVVNIINITTPEPEFGESKLFVVYDEASGMLLEMNMSTLIPAFPSADMSLHLSVVDTNIFGTGVMGWLQDNMIYIVTAVVVVIILVSAAVILRRGRKTSTLTKEPQTSGTQP